MLSYPTILLSLILLYILYKVFLEFFVDYLIAGYRLGFKNIAMIYRPLSTYATIHKQSLRKYKNASGHIHQIVRKNPSVKMILIRVLGITHLNVCDPEFIRKMSFDYVSHLNKRQLLVFSQEIEHGLIFAEGELWKKSRKLMSNMFHFDILQARSNIMEEVVLKKVKDLDLEKPNLFKLGCSIGGEIVLKSLFGQGYYDVDFDGRNPYEEINELMTELINTSRGYMNMLRVIFGIKLTKDSKIMTQQERKCLKRLLTFKEKSKDYLRVENQKYNKGENVSQFLKAYFDLNQPDIFEETVQQLFLFLLAGEDTTGALISSCLLSLSQYPKYQNSILSDVKKTNIHSSKQLNNFINQVNRRTAPVPNVLTRKVIEPFVIDGYTFKKGATVTLAIRNAMNNVKYWDNPEKFIPERFNQPLEYPNAYIPFSSGPRNCIGQHMAMMEVRLTIVKILERYVLEEDGDASVVVNKGVITLPLNQHSVRFNQKEKVESH